MNEKVQILLVEDEDSLNEVIALNLKLDGYEVTSVKDGQEAIDLLDQKRFHLIVLDVMLPNYDGFDITKHVRQSNQDTQIIIVSAKDTTADKIQGLKLGADDYLPKPFELEELLLRVKSLLRRNVNLQKQEKTYSFGDNTIHFNTFVAETKNGNIQLTNREANLLALLIQREGEVVSREDILQQVWGYGDIVPNTRSIDNFVLNFRKYFEQDPKTPRFFHSVWGVGYRFTK